LKSSEEELRNRQGRDIPDQVADSVAGGTRSPTLVFVLWRSIEIVTTLIAQIVPFARPNIQIYDAHVVDLYQWVCARYLVGVKGADTKAKRDLSSAHDRISKQITTDFQPKGPFGKPPRKTAFVLYFNRIWRRECQSIPIDIEAVFHSSAWEPTVPPTGN
jgi:hypothetical protein